MALTARGRRETFLINTKWEGPGAAKTGLKYRIRVLQTQKHQGATPCGSLWRKTMLLDGPFPWSLDRMMALDSLMSRLRQAPRMALVFCASLCLLYQASKADGKWGWGLSQGKPTYRQVRSLVRLAPKREKGNWLACKVSFPLEPGEEKKEDEKAGEGQERWKGDGT